MAGPYYVRSTDGSDASDGLTWANAKATLAGALAVAAAGERIWVSQAHAETQATDMTLTSAGTSAAPIEILCGDDAAEPPTALATTGTVTTTAAADMIWNGVVYVYGLGLNIGTSGGAELKLGATTTILSSFIFDTCAIALLTTNSTLADIWLGFQGGAAGADNALIVWKNCTVRMAGNASSSINLGSVNFFMDGGAFVTTNTPTVLMTPTAGAFAIARFRGVDLSIFGSGTSLVDVGLVTGSNRITFEQCKLGASVALTTGTPIGLGGHVVWLDNCDSGDTQTRMQRHSYEGNVYSETTIVRTGGASNGTTGLAHKLVSSANRTFYTPLVGPDLVRWNNTVGSAQTVTVEIVHDSVTNLKDHEVWLEVEYLGTSGFPLSLFASDRMTNIVSTPADQTDSSETWTTTGLTNPNTQKLAVTFTAQEIGILRARVVLAKPSYTVYVDPLLAVA